MTQQEEFLETKMAIQFQMTLMKLNGFSKELLYLGTPIGTSLVTLSHCLQTGSRWPSVNFTLLRSLAIHPIQRTVRLMGGRFTSSTGMVPLGSQRAPRLPNQLPRACRTLVTRFRSQRMVIFSRSAILSGNSSESTPGAAAFGNL